MALNKDMIPTKEKLEKKWWHRLIQAILWIGKMFVIITCIRLILEISSMITAGIPIKLIIRDLKNFFRIGF